MNNSWNKFEGSETNFQSILLFDNFRMQITARIARFKGARCGWITGGRHQEAAINQPRRAIIHRGPGSCRGGESPLACRAKDRRFDPGQDRQTQMLRPGPRWRPAGRNPVEGNLPGRSIRSRSTPSRGKGPRRASRFGSETSDGFDSHFPVHPEAVVQSAGPETASLQMRVRVPSASPFHAFVVQRQDAPLPRSKRRIIPGRKLQSPPVPHA